MTVFDEKKRPLLRMMTGGLLGVAGFLLLGWITQPGAFLGGGWDFDFTFCYNSNVPEALGAALGFLLWFLFGVEVGTATLPFADEGKALLLRSLCHFGIMALTLWGWVILNFPYEPLPGLALTFLLPFALCYLLIWLGRWVGWYAEVAQIRERLGLAPGPSPLKWRETLPHILFSAFLCLLLPLILRLCDDRTTPILSVFYAVVLLPVGGLCSACSLGKRHGICPLYPLACMAFTLVFISLARLFSNIADGELVLIAFVSTLLGNLLGAGIKALRGRRAP